MINVLRSWWSRILYDAVSLAPRYTFELEMAPYRYRASESIKWVLLGAEHVPIRVGELGRAGWRHRRCLSRGRSMTDALALVRGAVQLACFGSQLDGQMALIRRCSYRYKSGAMQDPLFVFLLD